jgi:glucan phosphoethanolaminetransferase (alkaline phosphatase superfamily)
MSLPMHVSVASSKKRKKKRLRKRWKILLVWLSILAVCASVWMMIFNVLGDDVYRADENSILGGIIFTTIALIAAVALTIGILDSRGHM